MSVKRELTTSLLDNTRNYSIQTESKSSPLRTTDRIAYLEKLLLYSGCWVFVGRKCFGDYIGFGLLIIVVIIDITSDYLLYFGSYSDDDQCDLSTLFIIFAVLRHIEILFRISFFVFKFHFIWKDPWISRHILNFEAEFEDEVIFNEPVLRKITSAFLGQWNIANVPENYDYLNQRRQSRTKLLNRFKTRVKRVKTFTKKPKKYKYPFKSQKMYKRIKFHCIVGCLLISIMTVVYRMCVASQLIDDMNTTSRLLLISQAVLIIGSVWTNLSMIIFFAVIFIYNFIAIRYIKFYFHRIITSCFSNNLKDLDGNNILQDYDDMYYFIQENNESFQLWVTWLIFYVALNWWIFLSLAAYGCDIYHFQWLSNIAYCTLYTVNLMILTWSALRVNAEFNALSINVADITEEIQFGYSRFAQFTQYQRLLLQSEANDHEKADKKVIDSMVLSELCDTDDERDDDDDDAMDQEEKKHMRNTSSLLLREYNKKQSDKSRSKKTTVDESGSFAWSPSESTMHALNEKQESVSLVQITRLMQLSNILDSRPCTFRIFGITFTESGIFGSVAAFVVGKVISVAMRWSFKLQ